MRITIKLFAIVRDRAGVPEVTLDLPEGATVAAAGEALAQRIPAVAQQLARTAFAVNRSYSTPATVLKDGDELAIIPPVSGG